MSLVRTVLEASDSIQNGRDTNHAIGKLREELKELPDEIIKRRDGEALGADGIIGEAVDVIQCIIDIVRLEYPDLSHDELVSEMERRMSAKCEKWRQKYADCDFSPNKFPFPY